MGDLFRKTSHRKTPQDAAATSFGCPDGAERGKTPFSERAKFALSLSIGFNVRIE
jgi:hypothetical protein